MENQTHPVLGGKAYLFRRSDSQHWQAAAYLNIGYRTLEKLRSTDGGPPCRKIAGAVLYRMDELDRWADTRTYLSTSDTVSKEVPHGASR